MMIAALEAAFVKSIFSPSFLDLDLPMSHLQASIRIFERSAASHVVHFAAISCPSCRMRLKIAKRSQEDKKNALSPHHAARPKSRYRAQILSRCAGAEGSSPHR